MTMPTMQELIRRIADESPAFTAWRNAQPDKYWKNWELSAIQIGYELGIAAQSEQDEQLRACRLLLSLPRVRALFPPLPDGAVLGSCSGDVHEA